MSFFAVLGDGGGFPKVMLLLLDTEHGLGVDLPKKE